MPLVLPSPEWEVDQMTDARFPDRWLVRRSFVTLPEPAFKLYVLSLMWAVSNRTDGALTATDLDFVPCPSGPDLRADLVAADMWTVTGRDSWRIEDFPTTQTSARQLAASEEYAARERERKAVDRAAKKVAKATSPQDSRADIRKTTQGQDSESDRTGEAVSEGTSRAVPSQRARDREERGWDE